MKTWLTLWAAALILVWPAFLNGYPLVFSDTGGMMFQGHGGDMGWDKPWIYAPFLLLFDGGTTLWLPMLAQGLLLAHALWLTLKSVGRASSLALIGVSALLAIGTAAPWFAALLIPDAFTSITILTLFVLAARPPALARSEMVWAGVLAAFCIAVHPTHIFVAAGCIAAAFLWQMRLSRRPVVPFGAAIAVLVFANVVGNRQFALSPYGGIFFLARLTADGPARAYLNAACPAAGYTLCQRLDRIPDDSDAFLWNGDGPVWANNSGPTFFAAEAQRVVVGTVRMFPADVAVDALRNAWRQLHLVEVGDALIPDYLDTTVGLRLRQFFPPNEQARFKASLQAAGALPALAAPFRPVHLALLAAGLIATIATVVVGLFRRTPLALLSALILAGCLANAFATGALSGPHHRYLARVAWVVVLPGAFALLPLRRPLRQAARLATSSGVMRTSDS